MTARTESTRRLFFAPWPTDDLRRAIEHETHSAARHSGGRVIPARNFHITLAFLGSVAESRIQELLGIRTAIDVAPFDLRLGNIVWWERQKLLCLEPIAGVELLAALVGRLQKVLRDKSYPVEQRVFRPHLTLAREVLRDHAFKPIRELHWQVNRIELVESKAEASGSIYSVLQS